MLVNSRSHELVHEKGKVGCLGSTMTRTHWEILRHLWVTLMAGCWNPLEASFLTCLPPCLGCLKSWAQLGLSTGPLTLSLSMWLRLLMVPQPVSKEGVSIYSQHFKTAMQKLRCLLWPSPRRSVESLPLQPLY